MEVKSTPSLITNMIIILKHGNSCGMNNIQHKKMIREYDVNE